MTIKKDQKQATILNIGVDSTSLTRVLTFVQDSLKRGHKFYIVTPNPEIILEASRDMELRRILNSADIAVADATGLSIAEKFLSMKTFPRMVAPIAYPIEWFIASVQRALVIKDPETRIKGRVLFLELLKLANKKGYKVFLFGGEKGEAEKAKANLEKSFKTVSIKAAEPGMYAKGGEPVSESDITKEIDIVNDINNFKPDLLFVALNTPKQEKFIDRLLPKLSIGGAMTVGGTFNYVAGLSKMPPKWISDSGFEWVWRLITEPWRFKRIFNAFVVFPCKVIVSKINR